MRRSNAILGSFLFLLLAPGIVAGVLPWWITRWQFRPPFFGIASLRVLGMLLIVAGLPPLLDSFARFALQGLGTPAPVLPTRHLVVTGFYRHVRNPMYVGVAAVILGQALLFGSVRLLEYGVAVWLGFDVFVRLYEEPKLTRTFGEEYREFRENVPRWIPRWSPWGKNYKNRYAVRSATIARSQQLFAGNPRRPDIPRGFPRCDRLAKGAGGKLIHRQAAVGFNFAVQERAIQLLYELYQFLGILLLAGCFGKYTPISNLDFHWSPP